jgi:hypothetical protein
VFIFENEQNPVNGTDMDPAGSFTGGTVFDVSPGGDGTPIAADEL